MTHGAMPPQVTGLLEELAQSDGVVAVTIGGSRATGMADENSDWDVGVFYEGAPDLGAVSRRGELHAPGSWGRFMNGGAWLVLDGVEVDVLLRDISVARHWADRARRGEFEIDHLLGHLAGWPSYTLVAEVACSRVVSGRIDIDTAFPAALTATAARRWEYHREFSLEYAMMHARRGDSTAALGNVVRAAMEEAHRRMAERGTWVLNEKRLLAEAGITATDWLEDGAVVDPAVLVESAARALRA